MIVCVAPVSTRKRVVARRRADTVAVTDTWPTTHSVARLQRRQKAARGASSPTAVRVSVRRSRLPLGTLLRRTGYQGSSRFFLPPLPWQTGIHELAREHVGTVGTTGLRAAVNTGEVVASEGTEIVGDPVNVAPRLQEAAADGEVVVGEATRRLVGALVTLSPLGNLASVVALRRCVASSSSTSPIAPARPCPGAFATRSPGSPGSTPFSAGTWKTRSEPGSSAPIDSTRPDRSPGWDL
jgi:hypothetical protein